MTILCILPGPSVFVGTKPDDRATRWCFTCRAHVPHEWRVYTDPPDADGMPSYYDPVCDLYCPKGHADTYFPGCGPWAW